MKLILKGENYTLVRKKQPTAFTVDKGEKGDRVDGQKVRESSEEMAV